MNIKFFKTSCIAFLFGIFIYACSGDSNSNSNNTSPTTAAQDRQNITNTFNEFYSCLNTLDDGQLSNFILYSLFNSGNEQYNETWLKNLTNQFELQYGVLVLNNRMEFASNKGVYTWDNVSQEWTKVASANVIQLKFPSKSDVATLDSELTLNSYADTPTSFNNVDYWLPTNVTGSLKRNGTTVFSINLSNITYNTGTNFSMPLSANITIFTSPFTHTIQWQRITNTDFRLSYSSSTPEGCSANSFELNVKLYDADYANIVSVKDDVKRINGSFTQGNLRVEYMVNVEGLSFYTDPTPAQVTANSTAEVYYNNQKIGDLSYDELDNQTEIFITYSDGTRENVDEYTSDFETTVRTIFANYLN
ncbi:MAG: hypothetical protein NTX74_06000 [Flavobacterium sp.]|nr:hypothetical protein [Flavobacterium sp.]